MSKILQRTRLDDQPLPQYSAERFHLLNLQPLAEQLVVGVPAITYLLHGIVTTKTLRAVYHLLEASSSIPSFKLSGRWAVRRSTIMAKWWLQERRAFEEQEDELLIRTHILLSALLPLLADICNRALKPDEALQVAHGVDEATTVIEQLLRVKQR